MNATFRSSIIAFCAIAFVLAVPICHAAESDVTKTPTKAAIPRLTESQAIELADAAVLKVGRKLTEYQEPKFANYSAKHRTWSVLFTGKSRVIGDHFSVSVDDRTGKTTIGSDGY